jgi:hypothetical protein
MESLVNNDFCFMQITKEIFDLIFPQGTSEWFELTEGRSDENNVYITLEEKDIPPLSKTNKNKKIIARKFHNITITDFPLRGKRTQLIIRRRYWKIEGEKEYLKRDIQLAFPGTQLEIEFANFLKETCGGNSDLALLCRDVSMPPD